MPRPDGDLSPERNGADSRRLDAVAVVEGQLLGEAGLHRKLRNDAPVYTIRDFRGYGGTPLGSAVRYYGLCRLLALLRSVALSGTRRDLPR
jgi:hypothetical protein